MQVHFTAVNVGRKFRDSSWCPPEIHVLLIGGLPNFVIIINYFITLSKCESEAVADWAWTML